MSSKRSKNTMSTWRCEETREKWSSRLYRDLLELGLGKQPCCKQHMCSKMKERLEQHRMNCPAAKTLQGGEKGPGNKTPVKPTMDQSSSTMKTNLSVGVSTRRKSPQTRKTKIDSVQTNLTFSEYNPIEKRGQYDVQAAQTNLTLFDDLNPAFNKQGNQAEKEHRLHDKIHIKLTETDQVEDKITLPVKNTETQILSSRNLYLDQLSKEIQEFFHDIPVFPNTSETVKLKRLNVIDDFVYKVAKLFAHINDEDYYDKVEREIDECLRNLPMWQPQSEQDKKAFKKCIGDSLLKFVKTFNEKLNNEGKDKGCRQKHSKSFLSYNDYENHNLEKEITNWVETNVHDCKQKEIVINTLVKNIKPMLRSGNNELLLKAEIAHILERLSPYFDFSRNKDVCVNILASDLTNRLRDTENIYDFNDENEYKSDTTENLAKWREKIEDETINQITEILFSNDDFTLHPKRHDVVRDIRRVLKSSADFTDSEASSLAKTLVTNLKDFFHEDIYAQMNNPIHSSSFLVLTSEQDLSAKSGPKFHSTLITDVRRKEISKLNKSEKTFIEKVSATIRTWLDTTDLTLDTKKDQAFKETIVDDITNDVHSIVKQSLQSQERRANIDEKLLNMAIMKGILKYELFKPPVTEESPKVVDLRRRIMALNTDDVLNTSALLEPQHGNRQAMANTKFSNMNDMWKGQVPLFQPIALDVLEDNISVWMNEQPSEIYNIKDKPTRNKLLREIAINIQDKITNKIPEDEIKKELTTWLNKIVKPQIKNVDGLAENLKDKIMKLPQDESLTRAHHKRFNDAPLKFDFSEQHSFINENDEKLNEYIDKYIQHNYNIEDDVINGVLKLMLKHELYKLNPSVREELYKNAINDEFNTDSFRMEHEIVQQVYEWLKDIPFYYQILKPGPEVIEFVHSLSKNIFDVETERLNHPNKMNYDSWLHTEIATFMLRKEAAITNYEDKAKIDHCTTQLCFRIMNLRKYPDNPSDELYTLVTNHMKKYDSLLSKDYLKKILWHRRLADNVNKLLVAKPAASRVDVEKVLGMIPFPRDESVFKYKMEIKYNITIHDWLHALPLVPIISDDEERVRKNRIKELIQQIIETDQRKLENPHDVQADADLNNYLVHWISQLSFETDNANVPALVSQLRSGLEYVKWSEIQPQRPADINAQRMSRSRRGSRSHDTEQKDPGEQMVEAIENWCSKLPIKEDNEEATKATKEQVATNVFQIVGSHIDDPRLANDNEKLRTILDNEIEIQLENLSQHNAIKENKDSLKAELLDNIMEIKNTIRDITAGDDYVHALENSIDESLSHRRQSSSNKKDPCYELFKKKTVMLWILENYDYAVDFHSLKYKKLLSEEIRSLSEEYQKRNLFSADKDEMMNDIMRELYDANPPNEDAIIDEVENIKLRCEIEVWANELPLKEAANYNTLLERDQILTILTKILFDIERSEAPDADEKMHLETIKWASKLQLISGEKDNLPRYADLLMCFIKASSDSRKCQRQPEPRNLTVLEETLSKLKAGEDLGVPKANLERISQVAGPSASTNYNGEGVTGDQITFLIMKTINNWCIQLPLEFETAEEENAIQRMKALISQRLLRFVSELHYRPNTLTNEGLYEYYLNNELEALLAQLTNDRVYWEAQQGRNNRKGQLINALKAIRPLIQDVKEREQYREELKHTISSFHESMAQHTGAELSQNAQQAIVEDFIQYKNHEGDFESQELYKLKINDALNNELNVNNDVDPLLAANRLICELSKVESPKNAQRDIARTVRRFSQPNPLDGIDRLPSTPSIRRRSLPYPLLQHSCPKFSPTHNVPGLTQHDMLYPGPAPQAPHGPSPLSTLSPRLASRRQSAPFPSASRPPRSSLNIQQELIPPPAFSPFPSPSRFAVQPFPFPAPPLNITSESNYLSPRQDPQNLIHYRQPDQLGLAEPVFAESSRERERPIEQQSVPSGVGAGSRITARARNSQRSTACPEEQRGRVRRPAGAQDYCETCERDTDCARHMRPYPTPMDYMYY